MEASTAVRERTEVELILESGIFAKAPQLERFFRYICERHFEGHADEIKEYSIALEALGRTSEFDPKRDSIVRVEAHRLRKRLEQYYRGPGAEHPIHIAIPNGQYRPQFVIRATDVVGSEKLTAGSIASEPELAPPDFAAVDLAAVPRPASIEPVSAKRSHIWRWPAGLAAGCMLIAALLILAHNTKTSVTSRSTAEVWSGTFNPASIPSELRMLCGYHGPPFEDRQGHTWFPDAYYKGGTSSLIPRGELIEAQPDRYLIRARRSGVFVYDIPLRPATYEVHLYVAETEYGQGNPKGGGDGTRVFRVSINGETKLREFDPLAEAGGPNRLHQRVFKDVSPAADGKVHLSFDPITAAPFLNAIEILPNPPGRIHPVRIVAQANPVTDSDGRLWAADEYFCGGTSVFRRNVILNRAEKVLYQGERYGNFSYRIPLAPGKYRVTLHFAETWFGMPESRQPALDRRIFNVFANGVALLREYQIVKDAGGPNRSVEKVFDNIEPNAQGILLLDFVPVKNYAEVNAIEVVETG